MGSNVAPPYAVAYMASFEEDFVYNHPLFMQHSRLWRRFIDDIFCIWNGPIETLLLFDSHISSIWPELKFTLQYSTEMISFLDTMLQKNAEGTLSIDLFTKTTDRNSLLEYTSFHPPAIKKSIPISQFQRVKRIVTQEDTKTLRLDEMEEKFSTRGYPSQLLTSARHATPRNRVSTSRIPFVNTFHPYSKRVQASLHKHWNILSKSYPNIPEFQQPFLPCYRRPTNIRDKLLNTRKFWPHLQRDSLSVSARHQRSRQQNVHSVGTSYAQAALSAQSRSPLVIMRCWHGTPEHDYGIVLLGTSLVRITIPQLIYVTHLDP
ncbi:unnamed protein product [Ranitomeya imitator]|uniref:Helix-turn-helix domain-containing protein n=1 Tax=Ranitomeya imitator TaxID=111125 RepID=A0ABN9KPA9_9NEOB|nr:unnamed protein product [Ranitomeya imitator]